MERINDTVASETEELDVATVEMPPADRAALQSCVQLLGALPSLDFQQELLPADCA